MLLSCPAKKVTKECGIGKALSVALPRAKDALLRISRRALNYYGAIRNDFYRK